MIALITTNPYAIVTDSNGDPLVYDDSVTTLRLPTGDVINGVGPGWSGKGYALVKVPPFVPSAGSQIAPGSPPSYAIDGQGNVTQSFSTQIIPPPPITTVQIASKSTPTINGTYSLDLTSLEKIAEIAEYIAVNNKFPDGLSAQPWPDTGGVSHSFTSIALWLAFATALADFDDALAQGQPPIQPVNIP
jgi:hypothetical protein